MPDFNDDRMSASAAGVSWARVSDELIEGVHHALNNRMAALGAVAQVIEADIPADHPLAGAIGGELQRLESTASLLSLLVDGREAEPVQVEYAFEQARQLVAIHHSLRDLRFESSVEEGVLPLLINPAALLRALLVLLSAAGARARNGGGVLSLRGRGDDREVELVVEAPDGNVDVEIGETGPADELGEVDPRDAEALLERWGGTVSIEANGESLLLRATLPTLPEVRKRERGGPS